MVYIALLIYHQIAAQIEGRRLFWLATKDQRTGLVNRGHFKLLITSEIRNSKARRKYDLSILLIDIDHFKKVNDTFGHKVGDEVLKALSELLRNNIRSLDVACRWGGEEFVIMLPGTPLENAQMVAQKIRLAIETHDFILGEKNIHHPVTVSIGATIMRRNESLDELIERADQGLYKAKESGRNCVCVMALE